MDTCIDVLSPKRLQNVDERLDIHYWQHHNSKPLNFATNTEDNDLQAVKKPKTPRDPMSHRIIEKRRRDRMNNCLADLSRLIPSNFMKQGQGRIEKTEIIEMAIKHIRQLKAKLETKDGSIGMSQQSVSTSNLLQKTCCSEKFFMGFKECQAELMRFLVENEGWDARDRICNRLMKKLDEASQKYIGNFGNSDTFNGELKPDADSPQSMGFRPNECMDRYNSPAPSSVYDGDYVDLATFKNNNCSAFTISQDKHLRTLLGKNHSPRSTGNESGIATEEHDTPMTDENLLTEKTSPDTRSPSSDPEHQEDCSSNGSASKRMDDNSTYKFKQNITLRFSEEKRKASDTSSVSSGEENNKVKHRRRVSKTKSMSPRSDSSTYPASDYSSNGNGTTSENLTSEKSSEHKHIKKECRLKEAHLPGFLLHPMGSFYFPISLSESQVSSLGILPLEDQPVSRHSTLLHPISIPVNFGSHFVTMRNINIENNFGSSKDSFCGGDQMNCSKS